MKFVIQRVKYASVEIGGEIFSKIDNGLLVFFCAEKEDKEGDLSFFANKILKLRIFEEEEKMNRSVLDIGGEILVVSQFTLAANCKKGTRPSFDSAMAPIPAKKMYEDFVEIITREYKNQVPEGFKGSDKTKTPVKTGVFGANMQIKLLNDGPVTIML